MIILWRDCLESVWCTRRPCSPRNSIGRGEDGTIISNRHECTVCVDDYLEFYRCTRSPRSPRVSFRWGEDISRITHRHKGIVSVGYSIEFIRFIGVIRSYSRSPCSPRGSVPWGEDGSLITNRNLWWNCLTCKYSSCLILAA
jgi:hypothetical protein